MSYCFECGTLLTSKWRRDDGNVPFCTSCHMYRYPMFNVAVSVEVLDSSQEKMILIQQYGKKSNVLVAGYINLGESAEHALIREVKEELGLDVVSYEYNKTKYYEKSNTLMINFSCTVNSTDLSNMDHKEVDYAKWYTLEEAKEEIKSGSLAEEFFLEFMQKRNKNRFLDKR